MQRPWLSEHLFAVTGIPVSYFNTIRRKSFQSGQTLGVYYDFSFLANGSSRIMVERTKYLTGSADRTSPGSGFYVGEVETDKEGRVRRGLSQNEAALARYLRKQYTGAFGIRFLDDKTFKLIFPHEFGLKLLAKLARLEGKRPEVQSGSRGWEVRVNHCRVKIDPYQYTFTFAVPEKTMRALLGIPRQADWEMVRNTDEACLFYAFDECFGRYRQYTEEWGNLDYAPDRILILLADKHEELRRRFLAGRRVKSPPLFPLPPISTERCVVKFRDFGEEEPDSSEQAVRKLIEYQRRIMRSCVNASSSKAGWKTSPIFPPYISEPDPYTYGSVWSDDHFMNAAAVSYFNGELAQNMILAGFRTFMMKKPAGTMIKVLPCPEFANAEGKKNKAYKKPPVFHNMQPLWALLTGVVYLNTGKLSFLRDCYKFLLQNYDSIRLEFFRNTPYANCRDIFWNDYGGSVPNEKRISVGFNAIVLLHMRMLAWIAGLLGDNRMRRRLLGDIGALAETMEALFWDEERGFYFDHDLGAGPAVSADHLLDINNLLPLAAGLPTPERAERMRPLLSRSDAYGMLPVFTSDCSGDTQNDRGLMGWAHTNWLVQIGLRSYGLHTLAERNSRNIVLALLRLHQRQRSIPECLEAKHGLDVGENTVVGGEGFAAFVEIFVRDALRKEYFILDRAENVLRRTGSGWKN